MGRIDWFRHKIASAKMLISGLFFRSPGVVPPLIRAPSRGIDVEDSGTWYFKRDILDRLDEYHACARRIKKTDPDGYALYSQIGASISVPNGGTWVNGLSPRWLRSDMRPAFGAVAFLFDDNSDDDDKIPVKFAYFHKRETCPSNVMWAPGDIYEVCGFWRDEIKYKKGGSALFYVAVDSGGKITPLKYRISTKQTIKHRDGIGGISVLAHQKWGYGFVLDDCVEHNQTHEEYAGTFFSLIVNGYEEASAGLRVSAKRGGVVAVFHIDLLRTPYFFADREAEFNEDGKKRKIFHIVRAHKRVLKDGRELYVRSHFRGLRKFTWGKYDVIVSMAGKHHNDVLDVNFGSYNEGEKPDLIGPVEVGRRLADHYSA